jgi:phosphohistidine phosphatase SixA
MITRTVSAAALRSWFFLPALLLCLLLPAMTTGPVRASEALWSDLRNGGIVLFRHALAPGTGDPDGFDVDDCSTQRNLDARGREDARAIGAAFRERGIMVGKVLTSQWCRCTETAELAFPGQVEEEPAFNSFFQDRSRGPAQTREAIDILSGWNGPGALVVVTHQVNITALTGIFPSSGEGILVRMEDGEPMTLGRLKP